MAQREATRLVGERGQIQVFETTRIGSAAEENSDGARGAEEAEAPRSGEIIAALSKC